MDVRRILGDLDINNFTGSIIAVFGTITLDGITQGIYCLIACLSFALTLKHSTDKHKRRLKQLDLNNKLLEQQIEKNKIENENKA